MTEITATNSMFSELSIAKKTEPETKESNELGQQAFLKLMITQLENQDPLSPQENTEFIAQLAQFSSVESLDSLNTQFEGFADNFVANQALQASSLVGRSVTVPAQTTQLEPGGVVTASVDIPMSSPEIKVFIRTEQGDLVDQIIAGPVEAGEAVVRWDGKNAELNGDRLDWQSSHEEGVGPGTYQIEIASNVDGDSTQLQTFLSANVNSVTVGQNGTLTLNLAGVGAKSLADVKQFNE